MSFDECELAILRDNVDKAEKLQGQELVNSPDIKKIITIVETFIQKNKLIIYGGTAINDILPKHDHFYDYNYELPDYDFFSMESLEHSKKLADLFVKHGFDNVEAKAGVHFGTYKVYVNNISVADITYLHPELYKSLMKDIIHKKKNIDDKPQLFENYTNNKTKLYESYLNLNNITNTIDEIINYIDKVILNSF